MLLQAAHWNEHSVQLFQIWEDGFTKPETGTIAHHYPLPLPICELHIRLIIWNYNTSHQCDNGLDGYSGNPLCMATNVTQAEISQTTVYFHQIMG